MTNRKARSRTVDQFHARGFNLITTDMSDHFESALFEHIQIDCAIIENPDHLPGGSIFLKNLQQGPRIIPTIVICDSADEIEKFETQNFPKISALTSEDGWEKIVETLIRYNIDDRNKPATRRHTRNPTSFRASCEVVPNRPVISCELKNISQSGAFVSANGFIPKIGQIVELEVDTGAKNGSRLLISGLVRWSQGVAGEPEVGFGMEFGFFNVDEKQALQNLSIDL